VNGPIFWFFQEWKDEQGRYWAQPFHLKIASEARQRHKDAAAFHWITRGMHEPFVSALYARDGAGVVELQQPCAPGDDPLRPDSGRPRSTAVPSVAGAGRVSSVVKAEAQRHDPGSTPGGSTGLPF
jgi:hypothetical protein